MRLSDRYEITIVTAKLRFSLPRKDFLRDTIPVRRVGLGLSIDKWLFPFLAPFAVRRVSTRASSRENSSASLRSDASSAHSLSTAQHDIVIIHAVLETFAGLALHFSRLLMPSAKRLLTLQTTNRSFLKGKIVRSPHHLTAISTALIKIASDLGRSDVTLIPNGLDLSTMPQREKVPGSVLFVGRLEPWKGIDVLLEAFKEITNHQSPITNASLRIVGEGSARKDLEKLSEELGLSDRVSFVGFVPIPEVYEEFAKAEIFCGLSRSEALGNVFLEAQAAGCAVIGTNIGGIPDIITHEQTGLLVPSDDSDAATAALSRLLTDGGLRSSLATAGRGNATKYDWSVISEEYAKVYGNLLQGV
jgi:glycosyltransferase involved in cell wall biosynthesis